jgi:hypothetical protein
MDTNTPVHWTLKKPQIPNQNRTAINGQNSLTLVRKPDLLPNYSKTPPSK